MLEPGVEGEGAVVEALAEGGVVGVGEEAIAEDENGLGDAVTEAVADAEALGVAFGFPMLPDAGLRRRMGSGEWRMAGTIRHSPFAIRSCPRSVQDAPESGEVGVAVFGFAEDGFEVEFEVVGTGQGFGIAEEAEGAAIGDEGPEAVAGGIEVFLGELVGGFFPGAGAVDGEAGIGVIKAEGVRGDDDGEAASEGLGGDGEGAEG